MLQGKVQVYVVANETAKLASQTPVGRETIMLGNAVGQSPRLITAFDEVTIASHAQKHAGVLENLQKEYVELAQRFFSLEDELKDSPYLAKQTSDNCIIEFNQAQDASLPIQSGLNLLAATIRQLVLKTLVGSDYHQARSAVTRAEVIVQDLSDGLDRLSQDVQVYFGCSRRVRELGEKFPARSDETGDESDRRDSGSFVEADTNVPEIVQDAADTSAAMPNIIPRPQLPPPTLRTGLNPQAECYFDKAVTVEERNRQKVYLWAMGVATGVAGTAPPGADESNGLHTIRELELGESATVTPELEEDDDEDAEVPDEFDGAVTWSAPAELITVADNAIPRFDPADAWMAEPMFPDEEEPFQTASILSFGARQKAVMIEIKKKS